MIHKTLTTLSLIGLLLSAGLWGASYFGLHYHKKPIHVEVARGGVSWVSGGMTQQERELRIALTRAKFRSFKMSWDYSEGEWVNVTPKRVTREEAAVQREIDALHQRKVWVDGFEGLHTHWLPKLSRTSSQRSWYIPMWITTLLFGVGAILPQAFIRLRRRKRKKLGLCVKCGYDLRGSKDRCPECGTEFSMQ